MNSESLPQDVLEFLQKLSIFKAVPFNYLVPDWDALPNESIRFFYLDINWIFSIIDGALSVGRNTKSDTESDVALIDEIMNKVLSQNHNIRLKLQGRPLKKAFTYEGFESISDIVFTGFLLRSALVQGWRGLEFRGYGKVGNEPEKERLDCLRMETLSNDILFCIFRGKLSKLEIIQPPESLHFGFSEAKAGKYEKALRNDVDGSLTEPKKTAVVSMREKEKRVVDMAQTANNIKDQLEYEITPAHFALNMIQNAFTGSIEIK